MRTLLMASAALLALGGCDTALPRVGNVSGLAEGMAAGDTLPAQRTANALAAPVRTDEDRVQDAARRTAEVLEFAAIGREPKIVDMIIGGGFWTRTFSAFAGTGGHVTAWQPAEFIGFQASYKDAINSVGALPNADAIRSPIGAPEFPPDVDLIFTNQNYHDLHLETFAADTAANVNAAAFRALKPGGYYVIIDHRAAPGSGLEAAQTLHRIDPDIVIQEVTAAGFVLDNRSAILEATADPLTGNIFDESIRGKTSQFMLRFRKPA